MGLSIETQERIMQEAISLSNGDYSKRLLIQIGMQSEALRSQQLEEALEKIMTMGLEPGETNYNYAFNRCWHIANNARDNYRNNLK